MVKDERCGSAANCVAGMVLEAAIEFAAVERTGGFSLQSRPQLSAWTGKTMRIGGYSVSLEELAPYPITSAAGDQGSSLRTIA